MPSKNPNAKKKVVKKKAAKKPVAKKKAVKSPKSKTQIKKSVPTAISSETEAELDDVVYPEPGTDEELSEDDLLSLDEDSTPEPEDE